MRKIIIKLLDFISGITCLSLIIVLTLELGFKFSQSNPEIFQLIHKYFFYVFSVDITLRLLLMKKNITYIFTHPTDAFILLSIIKHLLPDSTWLLSSLPLSEFALLMIVLGRTSHILNLIKLLRLNPAQIFILGFIFAIFTGTLLLSLPIATISPKGITFTDAFFTATSATCVTGLVTKNIGTTFSTFGHVVILILIQIGGLGIMSFSALLAVFMNRKFSHKESSQLQNSFDTLGAKESKTVLKSIFKYTFIFEAVGAAGLFLLWHKPNVSTKETVFLSIFHSISAFCNAGFSLFSNSLTHEAKNIPVLIIIATLIILGGLGFPVIFNIFQRRRTGSFKQSLKLHSKLTLTLTAGLLLIGTSFIFLLEYNHSMVNLSLLDKGVTSFFHSVSLRTAGFNTVDLSKFNESTLFIMMALMFIGAAPGSTAGGIKTTTLGILISTLIYDLRSIDEPTLFKRKITPQNIKKAVSILTLSTLTILLFQMGLTWVFPGNFLHTLFETFSAFGTVGLSLGITELLPNTGKLLIIVLMFIGRMGPLSLAFALYRKQKRRTYSYPEENILIA